MAQRTTWRARAAAHALVLAFLSVGCAAQTHLASPAVVEPADDALTTRAALTALSQHRYAKDASAELARATSWLDDAERRIANGDGDDDTTQLTLVAVHTQVAAIKSFYLRREAQDALEDARAGYAEDQGTVRSLEEENRNLE